MRGPKAILFGLFFVLALTAAMAFATVSSATTSTQIPDDLHLLVGKHVVIGRLPLCDQHTYNANLTYAGKTAVILAFEANKAMNASKLRSGQIRPNMRPMVEDAKKGGILEMQFEDGKKLDTCVDMLLSQLSPNLTLAPGETLSLPSIPSPVQRASINLHSQVCPVVITSASSGVSFGHSLIDALTTSELQRQLDETTHEGRGKHYLDMKASNAGSKVISAFEFAAVYQDKMGDETTSSTYVSQNSHGIAPGETYKAFAMDREEFSHNGAGNVTLFISRVRFNDNTFWQDDGSRSCSRSTVARVRTH